MSDERDDTEEEKPKRKPGIVRRVIGFTIFGLVVSVCIEWVYMAFWAEPNHAQRMLETELRYLHRDFQAVAYWVSHWHAIGYYYVFEVTYIEYVLLLISYDLGITEYMQAMLSTIQLFFVRMLILSFSLLSFALFSIAGATAGLALRDLRRYGGGLERGGLYHGAKWWLPKALAMAWIVYLAMPVSIHPNAIILPCAILTGLNVMLISSTYKKHL